MTRLTVRGRPPHRAMLAVFALLVTGCALLARDAATRAAKPSVVLPRPGEVLFVRAERRAALAALPAASREAWCRDPRLPALARAAAAPVAGLRGGRGEDDGPDPRAEPFARAVMAAAAAAFGAGDADARDALDGLLAGWAAADALAAPGPATANRRYALDRALLPIVVGFWLAGGGDAAAAAAAAVPDPVRAWLEGLLEGDSSPPAASTSARNNHAYLHASVAMAWGALTGDAARFAAGPRAYRRALRDMRPDGSLPLETRRGARALWYQRHALASLVTIAEMAAVQGQDLYGLDIDGRTVHAGIRFLLDAIDDPRRVWRYAAANENPGPERDWRRQDLGFLEPRGHGRRYMAWAEIYAARFPDRPETRRLLALLARSDPDFRPMVDDYSGGNATCFFARGPEAATAP